jgi:hypothetical protein
MKYQKNRNLGRVSTKNEYFFSLVSAIPAPVPIGPTQFTLPTYHISSKEEAFMALACERLGAELPSHGVGVQRRQTVLSSPSRASAVVGAELTRARIGGGRGRTR